MTPSNELNLRDFRLLDVELVVQNWLKANLINNLGWIKKHVFDDKKACIIMAA
jgi:hypothetical protein